MKKTLLLTAAVLLTVMLLSACGSVVPGIMSVSKSGTARNYSVAVNSANGNGDFHVLRTSQLKSIRGGSTVGVLTGGSGAFSVFMAAALEDKGLTVRAIDLYALTTPTQKSQTDPKADYSFVNSLVANSGDLMRLLAVTNEGEDQLGDKAATIEYLVEKLYTNDSIVVESQRINHFLTLVEDLKKLIASMNVDYILLAGPAYTELSFAVQIYNAATYELTFSNLFVGSLDEWRKVIARPAANENLSYEFPENKEPTPYWELSYCQYIASVLKVN